MPGKTKYTLGKGNDLHDITLPSGATCQARRPGVQGLIAAGLLDSFDQLTSLVKTEHLDTKAIGAMPKITSDEARAAAEVFMEDASKMQAAFQMVDRLVAYCITQPTVWVDYKMTFPSAKPKGESRVESDEDFEEREAQAEAAEAIAISKVDLDDKMYLLQWALGGIEDLALFREGRQ